MTYAEILGLPASERLQLLEAIWDSLTESPDAVPMSDAIREELDRRLEAYEKDPGTARQWDEIKEGLFRVK